MEIMDKYEINVWKDAELLSKETVNFKTQEECHAYVIKKYEAPGTWTGAHQNKHDVLINRPPVGIRVTWAKLTKDNYNYKPKRLTAEEKKMQRELYDSITPEIAAEIGRGEMIAKVRKDYYGHPNAKGMEDKK
jgi:hypothetical protein